MKNSVIYIENNRVIYNDYEYDYENLGEQQKLNNKRILFILNQDLYTKRMDYKKNQSINNLIISAFGEDEDYLFHYEFGHKKTEVVVYAIKGGNVVSFLCHGAKKIKVVPIQVYIAKKIVKIIKDKKWKLIFEFKGSYYYIVYEYNYIQCSFVYKF